MESRFLDILACPECHGNLAPAEGSLTCSNGECGIAYPVDKGIPVLVNDLDNLLDEKDRRSDLQNKVYAAAGNYFYSSFFTTTVFGMVRSLSEKIARKDGIRLDLGCCTGEHFSYTRNRGNVIGFDITMDFLRMAQNNFREPLYIQGTAYKLPFKDESIPAAYSLCALEHIGNMEQCVREVHRVLAPGGEFVFSLATENTFYNLCRKLTIRRHIEKQFDIDYITWTKNEHCSFSLDIISAVKQQFSIDKMIHIPFFLPVFPLSLFLVVKAVKK